MKTNLQFKKVMIALSAIWLTACGGSATQAPVGQLPTTAPTTLPINPTAVIVATKPAVATAAPALPVGDPLDIIRKAQIASTQRAYRSEVVSESKDGKTIIKGTFVPPGNLHVMTDSNGAQFEMFIVGDKLWTKRDGKVTESPNAKVTIAKTLEQYAKDPDSLGIKISDAKFIGPDVVNGAATWVYTLTSTMAEANFKSSGKIWIGVANGLVLKQESEGEFGGIKSKTTQTITYDPNLKVEAPTK